MDTTDQLRNELLDNLAHYCVEADAPEAAASAIFQMFVILDGESGEFPAFELSTSIRVRSSKPVAMASISAGGGLSLEVEDSEIVRLDNLLTGDTHHRFMEKYRELRDGTPEETS